MKTLLPQDVGKGSGPPSTLSAHSVTGTTPATFWGLGLCAERGCGRPALRLSTPIPGPALGACWLLELERPLRPHDTALGGRPPLGRPGGGFGSLPHPLPQPTPLGAQLLLWGLGREPPLRLCAQGLTASVETLPWTVCGGGDDNSAIRPVSPEHLPGCPLLPEPP